MDFSFLRKFLPGLIPLVIFIIADELWGTETGLYIAITSGLAELAFYYIRTRKIDRYILLDTLLLVVLGGISILLENEIFFKIKPAIIESILLIVIAFSLWGPKNLILTMSQRYVGEIRLTDGMEQVMKKNMKIMLAIITFHILLVLYSAEYMSDEAWAFISGGLFYIFFGLWFAGIWIFTRLKNRKYRNEEWLPVVNPEGKITGTAPRSICHDGKSKLLHPVVHLHIINKEGKIFLQKRSDSKDIQPGKWDTSVGGHIAPGETIEEALKREVREETGLTAFNAAFIKNYVWESEREKELVFSFICFSDEAPQVDMVEAVEGRFWSQAEIEQNLGKGIFTQNFENEYQIIKEKLVK